MDAANVNLTVYQMINDKFGDDIMLETIQNIKRNFDDCLGNLRLESLLSKSGSLQNHHFGLLDKEFLLNYGTTLVDYFGRDPMLDSKLLLLVEFILRELKKRDKPIMECLASCIWNRIQQLAPVHSEFVLMLVDASKTIFERIVLNFLESPLTMDYHVRTSSESAEIFQIVTSVLNEILIKSEGHETVLTLISSFVNKVMSVCQKERKNFLALYSSDCCQLVPLLMISPDAYSVEPEKSIGKNVVLKLILNMFKSNRKRTLLLLAHYVDWLLPFKFYLDENVGELA